MRLLNFVLIFGCAAAVFPHTSPCSLAKKRKCCYKLAKIYTIFIVSHNAASNVSPKPLLPKPTQNPKNVLIVFIFLVFELIQETVSSYFAWNFFETKGIFLRILPRNAGAIQLTVTLNNISRGSSLAFAFALPLVVLLQCVKCYRILVNQLWTTGRSNAGWKWKMRKHFRLISILKGCLAEINELNLACCCSTF